MDAIHRRSWRMDRDPRVTTLRLLGWARSAVFLVSVLLIMWLAFYAPAGEEVRLRLASAVAGVGFGWSATMQYYTWRYL